MNMAYTLKNHIILFINQIFGIQAQMVRKRPEKKQLLHS